MKNRIVSILTLGSFLVFSWSCYSLQEIRPAMLASENAGDYKIQKVKKTSGEIIEYPTSSPGRVSQGNITVNVKTAHGEYSLSLYTVSLAEVEKAWAKKFDVAGTLMAIVLPVSLVLVAKVLFYDLIMNNLLRWGSPSAGSTHTWNP